MFVNGKIQPPRRHPKRPNEILSVLERKKVVVKQYLSLSDAIKYIDLVAEWDRNDYFIEEIVT